MDKTLTTTPEFWSGSLALLTFLGIGVAVIWWLKRWQQTTTQDLSSPTEELAHFRELYQQGELSAGEYERIVQLLEQRTDTSAPE